MQALKRLVTQEPVALQAFVQITIALLAAFGLGWTAEQVGAVMAFTAAALALVARALVTPNTSVDKQVTQQVAAERADDVNTLSMEEFATLVELRKERDRLKGTLADRMRGGG